MRRRSIGDGAQAAALRSVGAAASTVAQRAIRDRGPASPPHEPLDEIEEFGRDRQFVSALARGLEILRAFQPGDGPLGNQELAQRTGLPKPTVSRLTYTLMRLGHLVYLPRLGKYQVGPAVLALGHLALGAMSVRQVARQRMETLAEYADLPVALGTRDRLSMIYAEACRSRKTVSLRYDVGTRIPIAVTAMGRAYLAGLPEREREYLLAKLTRRYCADWRQVRRGIDKAVEDLATRGFCASLGDWQADILSVGVPLRLPDGGGLMAINCGGPSFLVTQQKLEGDIGPRLVDLARSIRASGPAD